MIVLNLQQTPIAELRLVAQRRKAAIYRAANREKVANYNRAYRDRVRAAPQALGVYNARARASYAKCRARSLERRAAARDKNPADYMFKQKRDQARLHGIPFNLEVGDLQIPEFCPVLGLRLQRSRGRPSETSPSIDRIVPVLGYVKGNIRIISNRANRIRSNASVEELRAVLRYAESLLGPVLP